MKRRIPRRRKYLPTLVQLESRRLLTVAVTWKGQDGVDLVGTDASVGPDGLQDIHVQLSQLTGTPRSILVQGPKGFQWAYGPNLTGAANAEFFAPGDLYLNPRIRSNLDQNGSPLGSSTGALVTLHNNNRLDLTVTYQDGSTDSGSVTVSNLSPPSPMSKPATPANVVSGDFAVSNYGQDNTGPQGAVHLRITGLAGRVISTATLSDQAGAYWAYPDPTAQHSLWPVQEAPDNQSADLYFAPVRDETVSIPGVSTNSDMMLRLTFQNDTRQHVTQFAGGPWDPSRVANPLNGNSVTIRNDPDHPMDAGLALAAALGNPPSGGAEFDTITLDPNTPDPTIILTQPLRIDHSVKIIGNNYTLLFRAAWPASTPGAIYVNNSLGYGSDLLIDFEDFTIKFDTSVPNTWFDPENETGGVSHAVINLENPGQSRQVLTLSGMKIDGPPAFDPPRPNPDTFHVYVGEPAPNLVKTGQHDSGSITNSTFQGGVVEFFNGPWQVTGNTHLGAFARTFTASAFAAHSPHDLKFQNNHVSQSDPQGSIFRLINLANSGFNDVISNNTLGGGGGQVGNEVSYYAGANPRYYGLNDPEVMLTETNRIFFEGAPGARSSDGRILVLPMVSSTTASRAFIDSTTGPGLVVSILSVQNSDGSPNPLAGRWFRIAQQISSSPVTFLMLDPLPAGSYAISVVPGFVYESFNDNIIDISAKSSVALNLAGANFGTMVQGNNFKGGGKYVYPYTGRSVELSAYETNPDNSSAFPIPNQWTHNPSYDVTIQGNTTINSVGGVILDVYHDGTQKSETGRRYLTATVANNRFEWTQDFLNSWDTEFHQILNGSNNLANVYHDSSGNVYYDSSMPPTVTVGAGFSANGGDRAPWTVNIPPDYKVDPSHPRGFVDPVELSVTVTGNSANTSEPTGQVYAGLVNGVAYTSFPYTNYTAPIGNATSPYVPYNAKNLTIG
jgi:hypothetical protein